MSELITNNIQEEAFPKETFASLSTTGCNEDELCYFVATVGSQRQFSDLNSFLIQPFSLNQISSQRAGAESE